MKTRLTLTLAAAVVLCGFPIAGCHKADETEKRAPAPAANAVPGTAVKKDLPGPNQTRGMQTPAPKPPGL